MKPTNKRNESAIALVRQLLRRKVSIDKETLMPMLDEHGIFDADIERVKLRYKLQRTEELLRSLADEDGHRTWGHIKETDKDGHETSKYYQIALCDPPRLVRLEDYYIQMANAYMARANYIGQRIRIKSGDPARQLAFPWLEKEVAAD